MKKRGYTPEQVVEQIERRLADSAKYVQPQKRYADIVLRHMDATDDPNFVALEIDVQNTLDPLTLLDVLSSIDTLEVDWTSDDALLRDTLRVRGHAPKDALILVATGLIPNLDELVAEPEAWQPGGRGIAQLVLLHAISVRTRSDAEVREVA
ncbi:MAG: hypothetical protein U0235_07080 [Polyangiaceae bacterium]